VDYENPEKTIFPFYFGEVAKRTFLNVLATYMEEDLLTKLDVSILMLFAKAVEKVHEAEYKFATGEYTYTTFTAQGEKESTELKMHTINCNAVKNLSSLLLINPSSRRSVDLKSKKKAELTPLEQFISSRQAK